MPGYPCCCVQSTITPSTTICSICPSSEGVHNGVVFTIDGINREVTSRGCSDQCTGFNGASYSIPETSACGGSKCFQSTDYCCLANTLQYQSMRMSYGFYTTYPASIPPVDRPWYLGYTISQSIDDSSCCAVSAVEASATYKTTYFSSTKKCFDLLNETLTRDTDAGFFSHVNGCDFTSMTVTASAY